MGKVKQHLQTPRHDKAAADLAADPLIKAEAERTRRWETAQAAARKKREPYQREMERLISEKQRFDLLKAQQEAAGHKAREPYQDELDQLGAKGQLTAKESQRFDRLKAEAEAAARKAQESFNCEIEQAAPKRDLTDEESEYLNSLQDETELAGHEAFADHGFPKRSIDTPAQLGKWMDRIDEDLSKRGAPAAFEQLCEEAWPLALHLRKCDPSLPQRPKRAKDHRVAWEQLREWCIPAERPSGSAAKLKRLMTKGQKGLWDALAGHVMDAKELAAEEMLNTSENVIRQWVGDLKAAGYNIDHRSGRGYFRPDAPPPEINSQK